MNLRHEFRKLVGIQHLSISLISKLKYKDSLRGPIDMAHSCGSTRVATASRSTLEPIASCTAKVAICLVSSICFAILRAYHDRRLLCLDLGQERDQLGSQRSFIQGLDHCRETIESLDLDRQDPSFGKQDLGGFSMNLGSRRVLTATLTRRTF
jgi:hypothetical protein